MIFFLSHFILFWFFYFPKRFVQGIRRKHKIKNESINPRRAYYLLPILFERRQLLNVFRLNKFDCTGGTHGGTL